MKIQLHNNAHLNNIPKGNNQELKMACQDFESIFINYMFQKMKDTVPKTGFFGNSLGLDIAESMYGQALSEELARSGGIGLADTLYEQLSKYVD